jgi:glycosyltransferase involved in cell wall biosynthesis
MSCGTPVVSVDVGSIAESITSGVNGLLCAAGDGQQLARGIIQLLDEPLTRTEMGRRARQHVLRHASLDVMVGGYERLLHSLLVAKNPDLSAQSPTLAR